MPHCMGCAGACKGRKASRDCQSPNKQSQDIVCKWVSSTSWKGNANGGSTAPALQNSSVNPSCWDNFLQEQKKNRVAALWVCNRFAAELQAVHDTRKPHCQLQLLPQPGIHYWQVRFQVVSACNYLIQTKTLQTEVVLLYPWPKCTNCSWLTGALLAWVFGEVLAILVKKHEAHSIADVNTE